MVRVISVYHFASQSLHSINDDIVATAVISSNQICLAKSNHVIEILTVNQKENVDHNDNKREHKIQFPTVDEVRQVVYSGTGNYLATIEAKYETNEVFMRVYTNWQSINPKSGYNTAIRARIAGRVTPTNNTNCLEVIEIALDGQPHQIACCSITGNLAIAIGQQIFFYKLTACVNETTKCQYIDFLEIPFTVELEFVPTKLSIVENVCACCNDQFVNLFKIVESNDLQTDDISASSLTSDKSSVLAKTSSECIDFNEVDKEQFRVNIGPDMKNWSSSKGSISELRPISVSDMNISMKIQEEASLNLPNYTIKSVLQLRLLSCILGDSARNLNDPFKCLSLRPTYMYTPGNKLNGDEAGNSVHPLKSKHNHLFTHFSMVVSTSNDGYFYQFGMNDKWATEDVSYVALYPFTAPVQQVVLDDYVLHALTDTGIETYTIRSGHKIFSSLYDINDPAPNETCPSYDQSICLVGLRPFIGVRDLHCSGGSLILVANADVTSDNWTIYNLELPTPKQLYTDFVQLAQRHDALQNIYLDLMGEAHMILRVAKELCKIEYKSCSSGGPQITKNVDVDIDRLYIESCLKLADACVVANQKAVYTQAVAYYQMGKLSILDVYERVMAKGNSNSESMIGLSHTMKCMLLKLQENSHECEEILSTVRIKEASTAHSLHFGEEIFRLLFAYTPNEIAPLALKSQWLRDFMGTKIVTILHQKAAMTPEDRLCIVLDFINNSKIKEAHHWLEQFNEKDLTQVCTKYWPILFDTLTIHKNGLKRSTFSDFTEQCLLSTSSDKIQSCTINIFTHLLVDVKVLTLELMLKLEMDYLAAHVVHSGYRSAQTILQKTLESYFYNYYTNAKLTMCDFGGGDSSLTLSSSGSSLPKCSARNQTVTSNHTSIEQPPNYTECTNNAAIKILIRTYMGHLKSSENVSHDDSLQVPTDVKSYRADALQFMQANLDKVIEYHRSNVSNDDRDKSLHCCVSSFQELSSYEQYSDSIEGPAAAPANGGKSNHMRPILFLNKRFLFLNFMGPFVATDFEYNADESFTFQGFSDETKLTILKFQALLCSGILQGDIINEILYFLETNPTIIGIDSFISILLPVNDCIKFLINVCPHVLLIYGKYRMKTEDEWEFCIREFLAKKRPGFELESTFKFYSHMFEEILGYIVEEMSFKSVVKIFPSDELDWAVEQCESDPKEEENLEVESAKVFKSTRLSDCNLMLRYVQLAKDKDRSSRLREMIKTTGRQLYVAYLKNPEYFQ